MMSRAIRLLSLISFLAAACGLGVSAPSVKTVRTVAIPSGVGIVFRDFVSSIGGERVLGAVVSPDLATDGGGFIQYFQNAVLVYNPSAPAGEQVTLAPLGIQYHRPEPPAQPTPTAGAVYYAEFGHTVSLAFGEFHSAYGGVPVFGYPISDMLIENGKLVQNFERASFYYDETMPAGQRVQLAPLGYQECERVNCFGLVGPEPAIIALCAASAPSDLRTPATPSAAGEIKTWVESPVLPIGQAQTIYARVLAASGAGIPGLQPCVAVESSAGNIGIYASVTDANGQTSVTFQQAAWKAGEFVLYEVTVQAGDQSLIKRDEFIVWYGAEQKP